MEEQIVNKYYTEGYNEEKEVYKCGIEQDQKEKEENCEREHNQWGEKWNRSRSLSTRRFDPGGLVSLAWLVVRTSVHITNHAELPLSLLPNAIEKSTRVVMGDFPVHGAEAV